VRSPAGQSVRIDSKILYDLEKELRSLFNLHRIKIRKLSSRTTLIGNIKVGEIDLTFAFKDEAFHMKSYILEGQKGFLLSYIAAEKDFYPTENQAVQAIRSFRVRN